MNATAALPIVLLLCVLTGCASQSESAGAVDADAVVAAEARAETVPLSGASGNVVCRYEARTGSHLKRRQCFTRAQLRRMSAEAQEWLRSGGARGAVTKVPNRAGD